MHRFFKSVHSKFIVWLLVSSSFIAAIAGWANYNSIYNFYEDHFIQRAKILSNFLQHYYPSPNFIYNSDRDIELQRVVNVLANNDEIEDIIIIEKDTGRIVASSIAGKKGLPYEKINSSRVINRIKRAISINDSEKINIHDDGHGHIDITVQLFFKAVPQIVGIKNNSEYAHSVAFISISPGATKEAIDNITINITLTMVTVIAVIAFISYFVINNYVIDRIKDIAAAIDRKVEGEWNVKLPCVGNDEIAILSQSYNKLLDVEAKARERNKIFKQVLEHAAEVIEISDSKGNIIYVNKAYEDMTGYKADEVIGELYGVAKRPHEYEPGIYEDIIGETRRNKIWKGEVLAKRKDGSLWYQSISTSLVFNSVGKITNFISIKYDITKRREYEESLKESRYQAEEANRAKTSFLANMSHELRTPLNAIIGYSELLVNNYSITGDSDNEEHANNIYKSGKHLLDIINKILDMSKIEAGKMHVNDDVINIKYLLDDCVLLIGAKNQEHGKSKVVYDIAFNFPEILADELKLKQVLINLVNNSIKFSHGKPINIEARLSKKGEPLIIISDQGIGIAAEDIDRIMQPFEQAEGELNRHYEGTGLGLPICKALIDLHGGNINIESAPNQGTTVTITLPASRALIKKSLNVKIGNR